MKKQYTMEEFVGIIEQLRAPDGCPWDREQTHDTLRPCMMEEAAEFLASVRIYHETGNAENMCEELGDLLLQVIMHSVIAEEEKLFTIEDVITGISEKMIRRHPHVFGNANAENAQEVLVNWEEIKKAEKAKQSWVTSPLREIPQELPSLTRAVKVMKKVEKETPGDDYQITVAKLQDMVKELSDMNPSQETDKLGKQVADILMQVSRVSMLGKLQQEQLLYDSIEEYIEYHEEK